MSVRRTSSGDAPLLAWGEALRARRERRRTLLRRAAVVASGVALVGLTVAFRPAPRLVWNASASAPIGLYFVTPGATVATGQMVVARVPGRYRTLAALRHYIPANVPLVKRVAAVPGTDVCALGVHVFIDGKPVAERLERDAKGRWMPQWQGCYVLGSDQYFLLMAGKPASFDGRYFGITSRRDIIGTARLLWAR